MIADVPLAARGRIVLFVLLGSTIAGVYFATQLHLFYPAGLRRPWGEALAINLAHYWTWGALVPLVAWLARRFRFDERPWTAAAIHAVASFAVTAFQVVVAQLVVEGPFAIAPQADFVKVVRWNLYSSLPTYFLILAVVLSIDSTRRAAALESSLAAARLEALKSQLDPHFLFNTLNSVSALMYRDTAGADRMMSRLSELLRATIRDGGAQEVPLGEELENVRRYLDIESIRFEERLRVAIRTEPETLDALVPAFALQPLVENAIRHGIAPLEVGGRVEVEAKREHGTLTIRIADDGAGHAGGAIREGIGLRNTRARLAQLYGGRASLDCGAAAGGGFRVELRLPFRTANTAHA
jgi:anti-sigma regulatory factor (Ser/Thr protein kinase)